MNVKHTPGPWTVGTRAGFNANSVHHVDGENYDSGIATVFGINMHCTLDEIECSPECAEGLANARLIAAGPDLLAAARAALGVMRLLKFDTDPAAECLEFAIEKATGEPA